MVRRQCRPHRGIAGVAVTAERRGEKLLDELFRVVLEDGLRERGEAVSTLFCTAPGIYRKFGYELAPLLRRGPGPSEPCPDPPSGRRAHPPGHACRLRRGPRGLLHLGGRPERAADASRPSFPADANTFIDAFTGVTLAIDEAGDVVGFASWQRGQGSGDSSSLEVPDLLALSGDAYRALWSVLGSFGSVVGQVRVSTSGHDVARLALPSAHWTVKAREPYMLRVHDVPGAFAARDWPVDGDVSFTVAGDHVGTTNGSWQLVIDQGRATCTPTNGGRRSRPHARRARAGVGRRPDLRQPADGRAPLRRHA